MQRLLSEIDDEKLRAYIVFMPMLDVDDEATALERVAEFGDARLTYFWDEKRSSGHAWQETYDLDTTAWDVYFLYHVGATWSRLPTPADYGMTGHRAIGDIIPKLRIELFEAEARKLLQDS